MSAIIEAETALKQLTAEYPNATLVVQTLTAAAIAALLRWGRCRRWAARGRLVPALPGGGGARAGSVVKSGGNGCRVWRCAGGVVIYNGYQIEQRADLNRQQKMPRRSKSGNPVVLAGRRRCC